MKKTYKSIPVALCCILIAAFCFTFPAAATDTPDASDYNEAQLTALVNFFEFEIVAEDGETKLKNYLYADIELDLNKPWEYPGIVWNQTKPYSVLSIDLTAYPKLSGKLDLSSMVKLQKVDLSGTEIEWAVLGENSELTEFYASDSSMLSLDFSKCTRLETVECSNSSLQQLLLPEHSLKSLSCDRNYLTFGTLPAIGCAENYRYAPQKEAFFLGIGSINTLELGREADMSSYLADRITWYYDDGTPITDYTVSEQSYEFASLQLEDRIYAVMTSSAFPELTLTTEPITVAKSSKAIIRMFFGAVFFTFILFFGIRYMSAKKKGEELLSDKYTAKFSEKIDQFIAALSDKLKKKKGK